MKMIFDGSVIVLRRDVPTNLETSFEEPGIDVIHVCAETVIFIQETK